LFLTTLILALTAYTLAADCVTGAERPNIILLMGDDHGWDEVGYYGHPYLKTPVLDEMAATGLRMDRFYSAHPSCSPTRGSVLTGRHPNRYGTFSPNWSMRPEEVTVAHLLKKAGYTTGHFGKWHVGPVKKGSPTSPGAMGFDEWLSHDNFFEMDPVLSRNGGEPKEYPGESSEVVIEQTIRFIDRTRAEEKPFFIIVWFGSPHEPYEAMPKDLALYDAVVDRFPGKTTKLTSLETGRATTRPLGEVLRERYAEITAMDRAMGTLRDHLKATGLRDNTLLWYCGDNGTPGDGIVTSPFRGSKGRVYEGGVRVPGIIEWPAGIDGPRVSTINAVTSDMLPTLCDLAGVELPSRPLDGVSLKPLIENSMNERPKPIFFWGFNTGRFSRGEPRPYIDPKLQEGTTPLAKMMDGRFTRNFRNFHYDSIREGDYTGPRVILGNRYKLVVDGAGASKPSVELFDLRAEQAEQNDLAGQQPEVVKRLQKQLREWQSSVLNSLTGADYH
jgi:arylsulfatase A-like enzyme